MADLALFKKQRREQAEEASSAPVFSETENEQQMRTALSAWNAGYQESSNDAMYPSKTIEHYDKMVRSKRTIRIGDITPKMLHSHEFAANACEKDNEKRLFLVKIPILYFYHNTHSSIHEEMYRLQGATLHDVWVCKPLQSSYDRSTYSDMMYLYPKQTITDEQCEQKVVAIRHLEWPDPDSHTMTQGNIRNRCIGQLYGEKRYRLRRPPSQGKSYRDGKIHSVLFYKKMITPRVDSSLEGEMYSILQREYVEQQRKDDTPFDKWNPLTQFRIEMIQKHVFDRRYTLAARAKMLEREEEEYEQQRKRQRRFDDDDEENLPAADVEFEDVRGKSGNRSSVHYQEEDDEESGDDDDDFW